jgi:hypothetical protein
MQFEELVNKMVKDASLNRWKSFIR